MSIKKLFEKKKEQTSYDKGFVKKTISEFGQEVESGEFVDAYATASQAFIPNLDYDKPENFAKFGLAEKYYKSAIERIYKQYPYDGSLAEKLQFENSLTPLEKYIFENNYPRTNGFVTFNPASQESYTGTAEGGFKDSTTKEYITFHGWSTKSLYDLPNKQENALSIDFASGSTIEWWMRVGDWPSGVSYVAAFDLRDDEDLAQLVLSLNQSTTDKVRYNLKLGNGAGAWASKLAVALDTGLSWGDEQDTDDGKWHHYAVVQSSASSGFNIKLYVDSQKTDEYNTKNLTDYNDNVPFPAYITGTLQGTIGALGGALGTAGALGWGKFSGSIDEFRFWKAARTHEQIGRNYIVPIGGGLASSSVNKDLGVYFKFNEGIVGNATDATVLDYSGRGCDGTWTGYDSDITLAYSGSTGQRTTASAMVEAGVADRETKEPIIYSIHSDVQALLTNKEASGSQYDLTNNASLYNSMPKWILEEDEKGEELTQLLQIMGSYLDTLYGQVGELVKIREPSYAISGSTPYPFTGKLLNSMGFDAPEAFVGSDVLEAVFSQDDKRVYEDKLFKVKHLIYRNIYNNLVYINKSKGTEKAFRNLFRCFGVDDELVNLNMYGDNQTFTFEDNHNITYTKKKAIDFSGLSGSNRSATVFQYPLVSSDFGYLSSSENSHTPLTAEAEIIFPRFDHLTASIGDGLTTSSLFGCHTALASPTVTTYYSAGGGRANPGDFDVAAYAIRPFRDRRSSIDDPDAVYFRLTSSMMGFDLTSSVFPTSGSSGGDKVYNNSKWNFAFRVKPEEYPWTEDITSSQRRTIEFYGVQSVGGRIIHEFDLSKSIDIDKPDGAQEGRGIGHFLTGAYKRFYIGAERTNFNGALVNQSDVRFLNFSVWADYLTNDEIKYHARDPDNFGRTNPYQNTFVFETGSTNAGSAGTAGFVGHGIADVYVPRIDTLAFRWDFEHITGSEGVNIKVFDVVSGSASFQRADWPGSPAEQSGAYGPANAAYGNENYRDLVRASHTATGTFFEAGTEPYSLEFVPTARQALPEQMQSSDMISILTRDTEVFSRDTRPSKNFFAVEMSMYQVISKNMLNFFASIDDFNNLIGEPVNIYRGSYKGLEKLRYLFYQRVQNQPDVDKFINLYKWLDAALDSVLHNLIPASAAAATSARSLIESHILERHKYRHILPELTDVAKIGNITATENAGAAGAVKNSVAAAYQVLGRQHLIGVSMHSGKGPVGSPIVPFNRRSPSAMIDAVGEFNFDEEKSPYWWKHRAEKDREPFLLQAEATFTVADGDAASGMAEKEHVTIISTDGTEKRYVITNAASDGATATGTVLSDSGNTDTGAGTAGADEDGGIAVSINLSTATQNDFLVQLKAAIEHANGHDGEIIVSAVPAEANGNQSITLTQNGYGGVGNTVTTTDISQLTAGDFTGGGVPLPASDTRHQFQLNMQSASLNSSFSNVNVLIDFNSNAPSSRITSVRKPHRASSYISTFKESTAAKDGLFAAFATGSGTNKKGGILPVQLLDAPADELKNPRIKPMIVYSRDNSQDKGGQERLPFTVVSSAVEDGYASQLNKGTAASQWTRTSIEDSHKDIYGPHYEVPMQGPFTEENVGGNLYRHNNLFITASKVLRGKSRVEGYHVTITPAKDSLVLNNPRIFEGTYNSIYAWGARLRGVKRPVNIQNLSSSGYTVGDTDVAGKGPSRPNFGSAINSNYNKGYEVVSINDAAINNRYFVKNDGARAVETAYGGLDGQFWWVPDTKSYSPAALHPSIKNRIVDFTRIDRANTGSNSHIFVSKFSAPGSHADQGAGFTDIESGQFSPYSALPYRNLVVRKALDKLWARPAAIRGTDSLFGHEFANFHKVQRNDGVRITGSATDPLTRKIDRDNYWVSRAIPKNDLGYSWIKKSWIGHINADLTVSSTLGNVSHITSSDYAALLGFSSSADAVVFASASELGYAGLHYDGSVQSYYLAAQLGPDAFGPDSRSGVDTDGLFAPVDFAGMNLVIVEPITASLALLGPLYSVEYIKQVHDFTTGSENILGYPSASAVGAGHIYPHMLNYINESFGANIRLDSTAPANSPIGGERGVGTEPYVLNMILSHRGAIYGHPTWKQIRGHQHPLVRWHRKNNIYQNVRKAYDKQSNNFVNNVYQVVQSPVTSKHKPIVQGFKDFSIKYEFGNNFHFFAETYSSASNKINFNKKAWNIYPNYQKSALYEQSKKDWTILRYGETVFPKDENAHSRTARDRVVFEFGGWRDTETDRMQLLLDESDKMFGFINGSGIANSQAVYVGRLGGGIVESFLSGWPMDAYTESLGTDSTKYERSGELMRTDTVAFADIQKLEAMPDSASAKFGRYFHHCKPANLVHEQARKGPFDNSYAKYLQDLKLVGQNYSELAEFTITNEIRKIIVEQNNNFYDEELYSYEITGSGFRPAAGEIGWPMGITSSHRKHFLETYSHTGYMSELDHVRKLYGEPTEISVAFSAVKKFLPKVGFYPAQRTLQLATEFSKSYSAANPKNAIDYTLEEKQFVGQSNDIFTSSKPGKTGTWKTALEPFYAPGIMYNTIKAGLAVDYPVVDQATMDTGEFTRTTGSAGAPTSTQGPHASMHCSASYKSRLPFEAIIEPAYYAAKTRGSASFGQNVPHAPNSKNYAQGANLRLYDMDPEIIIDSTASIQHTDGVYERHAHNFFAEVPNFFLEKGIATLRSAPANEWSFEGPLSSSAHGIKKFAMDVSITKPQDFFMHEAASYFGHHPYLHHVPSYYGQELFYTCGPSVTSHVPCRTHHITGGFAHKYNKATMKVVFDPTKIANEDPVKFNSGLFDLTDIVANSTLEYSNFQFARYAPGETPVGMNITASIDLFNQTSDGAWVVNTKFETPIFNFAKVLTGSNPPSTIGGGVYKGIWHQYAPIPSGSDGLFFTAEAPETALGQKTGSLAEACGFSKEKSRLGEIAKEKIINEAVVAIPFYTDVQTKEEKFFKIPVAIFEESFKRVETEVVETSIDDMINKQCKSIYVLPPRYDFVRIRKKSKKPFIKPKDFLPARQPFIMYIFEFSHKLDQQDLGDIWQNVMPNSGRNIKKEDAIIKHPMTKGEFFSKEILEHNNFNKLPSDLRWKLFKVKQRANNNYFETIKGYISGSANNEKQYDFSANWPYDFLTFVNLGKMDIEFGFEKEVQISQQLHTGSAAASVAKLLTGTTSTNALHRHDYSVDENGDGLASKECVPGASEICHSHEIVGGEVMSAQSGCYPNCKSLYGVPGAAAHTHSIAPLGVFTNPNLGQAANPTGSDVGAAPGMGGGGGY